MNQGCQIPNIFIIMKNNLETLTLFNLFLSVW